MLIAWLKIALYANDSGCIDHAEENNAGLPFKERFREKKSDHDQEVQFGYKVIFPALKHHHEEHSDEQHESWNAGSYHGFHKLVMEIIKKVSGV